MASKDTERDQLASFLRSRPDLGLAAPIDSEEPDFLVEWGGARLGIELTQFSPARDGSGFIPEEQRSLRSRVMSEARRIFESQSAIALHVDAIFNDRRPVKPGRITQLADEMAEYLAWKASGIEIYAEVPFSAPEKHPYLSEVAHITAFRVPEPSYGVWYAGQAGWVSQAGAKDFIKILSRKEARLDSYRRKCDAVWLIVVFDLMAGGDHVEGPRAPAGFQLITGFDRVFGLDRVGDRCVEIPCRRP